MRSSTKVHWKCRRGFVAQCQAVIYCRGPPVQFISRILALWFGLSGKGIRLLWGCLGPRAWSPPFLRPPATVTTEPHGRWLATIYMDHMSGMIPQFPNIPPYSVHLPCQLLVKSVGIQQKSFFMLELDIPVHYWEIVHTSQCGDSTSEILGCWSDFPSHCGGREISVGHFFPK